MNLRTRVKELERRLRELEEVGRRNGDVREWIMTWALKDFEKCDFCGKHYPKYLVRKTGIKGTAYYAYPYTQSYEYEKKICEYCLETKKEECAEVKKIEGNK